MVFGGVEIPRKGCWMPAAGGGGKSRGAGQVFRLHFEMFPARTLRSVSPSALRVYIWQRMPGQRPPFAYTREPTPLLSPPFLAENSLFVCCTFIAFCAGARRLSSPSSLP